MGRPIHIHTYHWSSLPFWFGTVFLIPLSHCMCQSFLWVKTLLWMNHNKPLPIPQKLELWPACHGEIETRDNRTATCCAFFIGSQYPTSLGSTLAMFGFVLLNCRLTSHLEYQTPGLFRQRLPWVPTPSSYHCRGFQRGPPNFPVECERLPRIKLQTQRRREKNTEFVVGFYTGMSHISLNL